MEPYNTYVHIQMDGRVERRKERKEREGRETDRQTLVVFLHIN